MQKLLLAASAVFAASCAAGPGAIAQDATAAAPAPCSAEKFRQFDFWVGEWEVFAPNGQKAGDNSITIEEEGCLILETWNAADGSTGQSYNYVDHATGKWRQIWVSKHATIDYSGGLNEDGAMALEGKIASPTGQTAAFRGVWTLNDDGTVTQHFSQYSEEQETWVDWFIGTYHKKEASGE